MRQLATWLAVLGLYVQLAAAAACGAGASGSPAGPDTGRFPICHAQGGPERTGDGRAPAHQPDCPFCSIHCHLGLTLPPPGAFVAPFHVALKAEASALSVVLVAVRAVSAAQPRGPPLHG